MARTGDVKHNPDYVAQYPKACGGGGGENISYASGYAGGVTVELAFTGLVNSPGHYRNMVGPGYTHLGVGIAISENGSFFLTQNFAACAPYY